MNQLVSPNLSVVGTPDYCLAYVENVFGSPHIEPTAWAAWNATQFKHQDRNLPNVAVPIWCAWSGTVEGVYDNYGHVAVWTGSEVYTNPLSGSGHKVFPSIEAMESSYGVQFVGWSEDISTLRVAEGGQLMVDNNMLNNLYQAVFNRQPDHPGADGFIGQPADVVLQELLDSKEYAQLQAARTAQAQKLVDLQKEYDALKVLKAQEQATPDVPPVPVLPDLTNNVPTPPSDGAVTVTVNPVPPVVSTTTVSKPTSRVPRASNWFIRFIKWLLK